jgi:hypothetical protein
VKRPFRRKGTGGLGRQGPGGLGATRVFSLDAEEDLAIFDKDGLTLIDGVTFGRR